MLTISYRAKNNLATRAKFSHLDVIIVLTCLNYYHDDFSNKQLYTIFEKLLLFDHVQKQYDDQIKDASKLSFAIRQLTSINLSDFA